MNDLRRICVYCGSSNHVKPVFKAAARDVGDWLARHGVGVVFGGGSVGLMGELANAALAAGGEVIGVIPRKLLELELGHTGCTELKIVGDMHERKALMASLSDGFVTLPGGYGTLEEMFETITWGQLRYHDKPVGLLDVDGYYDNLVAFLERAVEEKFIRPAHRNLLLTAPDIGELVDQMRRWRPTPLDTWINNP